MNLKSRLAVVLCACTSYTYAAWLRFEAPGIEVYTSAGAAAGQDAIWRLTQMRHVFETKTGHRTPATLPLRVYVFGSESEYRHVSVGPQAAGFYAPDNDRDYIAVLASAGSLSRLLFHEYVHLLLRAGGAHPPAWLNEGSAEVYSTVRIKGRQIQFGDPVPAHVERLRASGTPRLSSLFEQEKASGIMFYAHSWAFVHMLSFSRDYRVGFPQFVSLVLGGTSPAEALTAAFHRPIEKVEADLSRWISGPVLPGEMVVAEERIQRTRVTPQPVDAVTAQLLVIELMGAAGRTTSAESALKRLAASHPNHAGVHEMLGDAAARRNDIPAARLHYEQAMKLGDSSGRLRYDYALLLRSAGAPEGEIARWLREAVAKDPALFDAHYLLGHLVRDLEAARIAAHLRPYSVDAQAQLSHLLYESGDRAGALEAAARARRLARSPDQIERTEAAMRLFAEEPRKPAPAAKPRPSLHSVEGRLVQVDCLDDKARLHVITESGKVFLLIRDRGGLQAPHVELSCAETYRAVRIEYRSALDETYGTIGDVTAIAVR